MKSGMMEGRGDGLDSGMVGGRGEGVDSGMMGGRDREWIVGYGKVRVFGVDS